MKTEDYGTPEETADGHAVLECSVDSNDAISVEFDEHSGFMFELLGSKDPVHLLPNEAKQLAEWILKKADAGGY